MVIRQILQLKSKGQSNRKIAQYLAISRNTVNEYVKRFELSGRACKSLLDMSDSDLSELFSSKDYKDHDRYESLLAWLKDNLKALQQVGCTKEKLWHQYKGTQTNSYGYTQFVYYINQQLQKKQYSGILIHEPGSSLQIDFTGKKLSYIDRQTGEQIFTEFFLAVLPHSQYAYGQVCHSQKVEDFIDCLNNCFQALGGVPHALVPDNLKSAVSKAKRHQPLINPNLKKLALHYNTTVIPARPYHPKDKALVERAVTLIYQRVFYPLNNQQFFSLAQLNQAVQGLMAHYNNYLFYNAKVSRADLFREEQKHLQSLPNGTYELRTFKKAKVQMTSFIYLHQENQYFSVPYRYIGQHVHIEYNNKFVEIYHDDTRIALHHRTPHDSKYVTIEKHLPSTHQAYRGWSPDHFAERASKIGPSVVQYIAKLIDQFKYPEHAFRQAHGILRLAKVYSATQLEQACAVGLQMSLCGMSKIEQILKNKTYESTPPTKTATPSIGEHENLRDPHQYY